MSNDEMSQELIKLMHELNDDKIAGRDTNGDLVFDIGDLLADGISYKDIENAVAPELIVQTFTLCAEHLLQSKDDDHFCLQAAQILKLSSPDAEKTEEYKKLFARADEIASISRNTLDEGNTIDVSGSHVASLPFLLQQFAVVKGEAVKSKHFTAVPADFSASNSFPARFKSCAIIRPKDGEPILATGRLCQPLIVVEQALKALALTRDL